MENGNREEFIDRSVGPLIDSMARLFLDALIGQREEISWAPNPIYVHFPQSLPHLFSLFPAPVVSYRAPSPVGRWVLGDWEEWGYRG